MANGPHHPHRIPAYPARRVAGDPDDPPIEIVDAADVIENCAPFDLEKKGIDGEIAASGILAQGAEGVVGSQDLFRSVQVVLAERPQSADLDGLAALEEDLDQPKAAADGVAVGEEFSELTGPSIRADIEILRSFAEIEIAHAAADQIAGKTGIAQFLEDKERVAVNQLGADRVLVSGYDPDGRGCNGNGWFKYEFFVDEGVHGKEGKRQVAGQNPRPSWYTDSACVLNCLNISATERMFFIL
ncbi:MAG: hypothetical protein ACD_75C00314G0002 [uncultured bacterium]|nr:MAG: hypothetical protein ACD_75C00314G0002 [uncultured bacterium]